MRHPARHARNIIVESTFDVGRRFRCRIRVDCGQLACAIEPGALSQAEQWINARRMEWEHRLDRLGEYLKTLEPKEIVMAQMVRTRPTFSERTKPASSKTSHATRSQLA
jgi:hypothetical protein